MWIGMSLFLLSIPVLEPLYKWLATSILGIEDARHIIYITLIGFLLIHLFYLTAMVSQMSNQIRQLISNQAIHTSMVEGKATTETQPRPSRPS
jgi:hypothetical protein